MASGKIEKVTSESGAGYCKMPDGTLICWGSVSVEAGAWSADVSLPASFANTAYAVVDAPRCNTTVAVNVLVGKTGVDKFIFYMTRNDLAVEIDYLAIGRWK